MSGVIVTVDGPSGTGKSTVSKAVAQKANLPHLDTGAFYRAATLAVLRSGVDLGDQNAVAKVVSVLSLDQDDGRMFLDGVDVSEEVRSDRVTSAVSSLSAHAEVRQILVGHQRDWIDHHGGQGVVEGRDIGSVVFPDAALKIYLDARPEVRASRRAHQVGEDPDDVIEELARRDHVDSTREASPLKVPDGAIVVDTSDLDFDQVVERVLSLLPLES
jgi:cytidylate kinase